MVASESSEVGNPGTLGMTKGTVGAYLGIVDRVEGPALRLSDLPNFPSKPQPQTEVSSRPERTRISCHTALDKATRAPFRKEGRMKCNNATKFHRKSGVA